MKQAMIYEWKSGLAFRRIVLGILWCICLLFGIIGCALGVYRVIILMEPNELPMLVMGILFLLIAYMSHKSAYQNVCITYQCFPILNQILSVSRQQELLHDDEDFYPIEELQSIHCKYTKWDRMESRHWLRIKGYYISKELLIGVDFYNTHGRHAYRRSTYMRVVYVNGKTFEMRLEDALHKDELLNYRYYFAEHCGTTSYIQDRKLLDSIHNTFCKYIEQRNYSSEEEALTAFARDGADLRKYIKGKYQHFWEREKKD